MSLEHRRLLDHPPGFRPFRGTGLFERIGGQPTGCRSRPSWPTGGSPQRIGDRRGSSRIGIHARGELPALIREVLADDDRLRAAGDDDLPVAVGRPGGHVGTGFSQAALADLLRRLRPLETGTSPFGTPVPAEHARGAHWARPRLVGEVTFAEWTSDGSMRHPSWRGLRPDKSPGEVGRRG